MVSPQRLLAEGIRVRPILDCPLCGEIFTLQKQTQSHIYQVHPGQKPFSCPFYPDCHTRFRDIGAYKKHIKTKDHGDALKGACKRCGKVIMKTRNDNIKLHAKRCKGRKHIRKSSEDSTSPKAQSTGDVSPSIVDGDPATAAPEYPQGGSSGLQQHFQTAIFSQTKRDNLLGVNSANDLPEAPGPSAGCNPAPDRTGISPSTFRFLPNLPPLGIGEHGGWGSLQASHSSEWAWGNAYPNQAPFNSDAASFISTEFSQSGNYFLPPPAVPSTPAAYTSTPSGAPSSGLLNALPSSDPGPFWVNTEHQPSALPGPSSHEGSGWPGLDINYPQVPLAESYEMISGYPPNSPATRWLGRANDS